MSLDEAAADWLSGHGAEAASGGPVEFPTVTSEAKLQSWSQ